MSPPSRRGLLTLGLAAVLPRVEAAAPSSAFEREAAAIEARAGGTIGVAALDTGTQRRLAYRGDRRMAMCSVFKLPLACAVAAGVDSGRLRWDQPVRFGPGDLQHYAPVVRAHLDAGVLTVGELCAAILEVSDNAAANLLLGLIGGPRGLTSFLRRHGDSVTRLDRREPELNTNLPGDPRDTSTPNALVQTMQHFLLGDALSPDSRERLIGAMVAAKTGLTRLRAGLPAGWRIGDKTGSGSRAAWNDVAIAWPSADRKPILIAMLTSGSPRPQDDVDAAHAAIARLVAATWA